MQNWAKGVHVDTSPVGITVQNNTAPLERFEGKDIQVGVIGLGYVGLPLALLFSRKGFSTTGFDTDPSKIEKLEAGQTYIKHISASAIAAEIKENRFRAFSAFERLRDMDAIIVCVPTPLDEHREPDLSYVQRTSDTISQHLRQGQLVIIESTTYPGTTDELVLSTLERSGLRCPIAPYTDNDQKVAYPDPGAVDFLLAFSPEREDPGNTQFQTHQVPKVIGGVNGPSARATQALYSQVFDRTVVVSSSRAAEMTKILENTYRCVNIALVNELKLLCLRMGIDIWEVIEAAKTKPFGFTPFFPGPGLGGHCIPIDPFYLTWKAREYDFPTRFIELAGEINSAMPEHVVSSLIDALSRKKEALMDAHILVLGISYKKDIDDLRESPSLRIIKLLQGRGAHVEYHDPYFPQLHQMRHYNFQGMRSIDLTPDKLNRYSAVVIATDHSSYDYNFIVRNARLVIDTRNATRDVTDHRDRIVLC
jgi:UDP-N-acetyl-D-glucosamine dehydrogenase